MNSLVMINCLAENKLDVVDRLINQGIEFEEVDGPKMTAGDVIAAILIAVPTSTVTILVERLVQKILPSDSIINVFIDGKQFVSNGEIHVNPTTE